MTVLPIPYRSQEDSDSRKYHNDCGSACVAMIIEWAGGITIPIDSLSAETSLSFSDTGLSAYQVAALLDKHGIKSHSMTGVTVDMIRHEIKAGRPVIALISYAPIKERENQADHYGHFVVVAGIDDQHVVINDPDFYGAVRVRGDHLPVTLAEFEQALEKSPAPNSAIFIERLQVADTSQPGTSADAPKRSIPVGLAVVNTAELNVRAEPAGNAIIAQLSYSMKVEITSEVPVAALLNGVSHVWVHIRYISGVSECVGWCAEELLIAAPQQPNPPQTPPDPTIQRTIPVGYAHVNTDSLNVRSAPGGTTILIALPRDTNIIALDTPPVKALLNGLEHTWLHIQYGSGGSGWVAEELLAMGRAAVPIPAQPHPTTSVYKLLGLHGMGSTTLPPADAAKYGIYKSVENPDFLEKCYGINPHAIHIYRKYRSGSDNDPSAYIALHGGVQAAVQAWLNEMQPLFLAVPFAYFESFNEAGAGSDYLAFEAERARQMKSRGLKACVLNIQTGNSDASTWHNGRDMVQACIDTGSIVGVHGYSQTVMSANYGSSYFDSAGNWHGDLFPAALPITHDLQAWTGLRVLRDIAFCIEQSQSAVRFVQTESGLDDVVQPGNGIYYPASGKTRGWKTCETAWKALGLLDNGVSPAQAYMKQLEWYAGVLGRAGQYAGGVVYTYGTDDPEWGSYDVSGVM